jgi:hypothetical protein
MLMLIIGLIFGAASCTRFFKKDKGKHMGWYRNSNNPHHINSTNPGKFRSEAKQ